MPLPFDPLKALATSLQQPVVGDPSVMEMDGCLTGPPTLSSRMTPTLLLLIGFVPVLSAGHLSEWQLQQPWEMVSQTLLPSPLLHVPIPLRADEEEFLLAQGRFGSDVSGDAISPLLSATSSSRMLTFKYAKVGAADLQILLKEGETFRLLDSLTENTGGKWHDRTTLLPGGEGSQQLIFRARGILDGLDAVAVSSIQIRYSPTSVLSVAKNIPKGVRRKPIAKPKAKGICQPIYCSFHQTSCQWSFHGFTPLDGKIVAKNSGVLSSEPILHPPNAHFQMEIFVSENAASTVHQHLGSEEQLLWTAGGVALPGWNTVRFPLRFSSLPSKLMIRASSLQGGYVAVRNTKLVDEFGNELSCGLNVPPIRPKKDETIRLTAVQRLDPERPIISQVTCALFATSFQASTHSRLPFPLFIAKTTTQRPSPTLPTAHKSSQISLPTNFKKNSTDIDKWKLLAKQFGLSGKAIVPINEAASNIPQKDIHPFLPAGLPPSLQKALSEKLSSLIELPPSTSSRETRPFSRQSMDWVIQHAFNSFMNNARP